LQNSGQNFNASYFFVSQQRWCFLWIIFFLHFTNKRGFQKIEDSPLESQSIGHARVWSRKHIMSQMLVEIRIKWQTHGHKNIWTQFYFQPYPFFRPLF